MRKATFRSHESTCVNLAIMPRTLLLRAVLLAAQDLSVKLKREGCNSSCTGL